MSVYVPTFPLAGSLISAAPAQFQINFTQANDIFGIDHSTFNVSGSAGTGYHKRVTFGTVSDNPDQVSPISSLYTKVVGTPAVPQLFFQNGNMDANVIQVTTDGSFQTYTPTVTLTGGSLTGPTINGYYAFVGGLIYLTVTIAYTGVMQSPGPVTNVNVTLPTTAKSTGGTLLMTGPGIGSRTLPVLISATNTSANFPVGSLTGANNVTISGFYN